MEQINRPTGNIHLGAWSFNEISIKDMDLYSQYIKKTEYPVNLWSSNFAFVWAVSQSKARKILWRIVDEMLVTFGYLIDGTLYLICLPLGEGGPEKLFNVLYKCFRYCLAWNNHDNSSTVLKVVNSLQLDFLRNYKDFDRYFRAIPLVGLEKHFSIQKLVALSGKEFETVRRKINKFHRTYPNAIVREYRPEDYADVMKLGEYWSNTAGQKYSHVFDGVYFPAIISHYKELHHMVFVVEVEGKVVGMVSGGPLPNGQSWWCISKYRTEMDGLSELLIVELAKKINNIDSNIQLMNAGEDLGSEGLRFFKERFRPVLDLKRYVLQLR